MKKLIYILTLFILSACGNTTQKSEKPILTVTLEPLRYFTEAIAGDNYEVVSMVPKGSSPESYDPTPRQLTTLADSKAFLGIGYIGYETAWHDRLKANAPQVPFFNLSEGVELIKAEHHHHGHEGHHHVHGVGVEPHTWTSPRTAMTIVRGIADALSQIDDAHSALYQQRADSLLQHLQQIDQQLTEQFASDSTNKAFLIYHPSLSYLARDYGLQQLCIEEEGREPSAAHLKELIDRCRRQGVRTIFIQPEFDRKHAEAIAQEIGDVEVVEINPLAYEWEEELMRVIHNL